MNPSFDRWTPIGFNGDIYAQAVQNDGKVLIGGYFTSYQWIVANRIIRLNADGTNDYSFTIWSWFDALVRKILIQPDGKILIQGNFHTYNGIAAHQLIRLNNDWSIDETFSSGTGFDLSLLYALTIQDDGKILVGWDFSFYRWQSANKLIRLNTDGSRDNTFDIIDWFDGVVRSIAVQNDGKIIAGGGFASFRWSGGVLSCSDHQYTDQVSCESPWSCEDGTSLDKATCEAPRCNDFEASPDETTCLENGWLWEQMFVWVNDNTRAESKAANGIIRLNSDWSRDTTFVMWEWFDAGWFNPGHISTLAIQEDGKVIVGGTFTRYNGVATNKIIRLHTGGTMDTEFLMWNWFNGEVTSLLIQNNGNIVVGWMFSSYDSIRANKLARLHTNGTIDTEFPMWIGFNDTIYSLTIQDDQKLLVGGTFTAYNGVAVSKITRLHINGEKDASFVVWNWFDNEIKTIVEQADGKIIAGWYFTTYNGMSANKIVRIHTNGTIDTGFLIWSGFNGTVWALAIQDDGKIIVGWAFTGYNWTTVNKIARLNSDGTLDTEFLIWSGFNNTINTLAIQGDGKIVVGWYFTAYNWTTANRIIRLNRNGSVDTGFFIWAGFTNVVSAIVIQSDGKIIIGWAFTTYSWVVVNRIVRTNTDGTLDTGFLIWSGFGGTIVSALAIQNDGKIVVWGNFLTYQWAQASRIVRLNTDGTRDIDFVTNSGFIVSVNALAIQDNGKILVWGAFTTYKSLPANRIICLYSDGSRDPNFDVGSWFNNTVNTITIKNNKEIIVGWLFTTYQNQTDPYIASLYGDSDLVILPNSSDDAIMKNEFTSKWYVQSGLDLVWSNAISLSQTSGYIPVALNLKNQNIQLDIQADTQFKEADATTNYEGIISMPAIKSIESINDEDVITAFNMGSPESLYLSWWIATLSMTVPNESVWSTVQIYYSEDNGVTRYPQTQTFVTENNWAPYISFTTTHFTDFAVTLPQSSMTWLFTINNDDTSTTSANVTLNISTTPEAINMRFSHDGLIRTERASYTTTTSWTLTDGTWNKTVYAQFDFDGDDSSDVDMNDTILLVAEEDITPPEDTWHVTPPTGNDGSPELVKDQCPVQRDCSSSYYDQLCGPCTTTGTEIHPSATPYCPAYSNKLNQAYGFAFDNGITTINNCTTVNLTGILIRSHMAKMISEFAIRVLKIKPDTTKSCTFTDMKTQSKEMQFYATLACQLGLMWYESDGVTMNINFNPEQEVDRAQFGTILSRLLRWAKNNGSTPYYLKHLQALKTAWIMTKIDTPNQKEMRGRVMLMMQRIFEK